MLVSKLSKKLRNNALKRSKSGVAKKAGFGLLGLIGGLSAALFCVAQVDEGTERSLSFWIGVAPIYAHYRYLQYTVDKFSITP
jgi:hypothetical protein